jgi:hypothetical protein
MSTRGVVLTMRNGPGSMLQAMPTLLPGRARKRARYREAVEAAIDAAGGQVAIDPPSYPMSEDHLAAFRLTLALAKAGRVHVYVFPDQDRLRLDACYVCGQSFGDDIHGKRPQPGGAPQAR